MHVLSQNDFNLFESLAGLTQESLRKTLSSFLKKKYKKVTITKDYVYAQGDIPIALVAHMDTVFKKPPTEVYYDKQKNVMWSPQGLGADDRAGVFAILKIIQSGLRPAVIFTTDEESGALGAEAMTKAYKDAPQEFKYIIQLDRRGTNDCVFYDCANKKFEAYVESFGFVTNWGSFSDISVLCPAWGIAGVNLSIGYMNEHQEIETLHVSHMMRTISLVKKMLKGAEEAESFEYIPDPTAYMYSYYKNGWLKGGNWWIDEEEEVDKFFFDTDYFFNSEGKYICDACGKTGFQDYEMVPVKDENGNVVARYCPDCCAANLDWCVQCYEPFLPETDPEDTHTCPMCRNSKHKPVTKGGHHPYAV